jgi:hypothetical protein
MSAVLTDEELARRVAAAQERAEAEPAVTWKPRDRAAQHPRMIAGLVVEKGLKLGAGYNGEDIVTVTIQTPGGPSWLVWTFGRVLEQDLAPCKVGDVVAVKYEGHREGKGNGYELFRVVRDAGSSPGLAEAPSSAPAVAAAQTCLECGFASADGHAAGCSLDDVPF